VQEKSRPAFVALLTGAVGIAFAPIFVRLSEVGPSATAFYRVFFALPVLWLWRLQERHKPDAPARPAGPKDYGQLFVAGLLFAGDLALWHWSIRLTSVANATLFANFAPIFVTLGARVLFSEKVTPTFLVAMAVALTGAAMVVGNSLNATTKHVAGDLVGIATAVFYAGYMLSVKHLRRSFSTATIMAWSGLSASPVLFLVALASGERLVPMYASGWIVVIALALISQVGGQSLIAYAFAHLPASFSSLSLLVQPAVAAFLAWIILAEPLGLFQAFGGAVILCGIAVAGRADRDGN
jgi:drug/metabolite transporter (DMT)-like permease